MFEVLSFNVIFSSSYTDGKVASIWQIINQKEKSDKKEMNKL